MGHIRRYFRDGALPPASTICDIEDTFFGTPKPVFHVTSQQDTDIIDATRLLSRQFHELQALNGYLL